MTKSGEKLEKVAKSWKKWRKVGISGKKFKRNFFCKNGRRRPFWITKNHFRSHFSPFQINTQLFFLNFFSIAFLAISDQYATFFFEFFFKMVDGRHFGSPFWAILDDRKSLSIAFLAISDQYATFFFFEYFGSPICAKNNRLLPLCVINGYAKYEVDR